MAIKLIDQYPGRVNPATSDYPYGSIKNETVPDANDGTPLDQAWGNNIEGFLQALLGAAGIAPNGVIEKAGASQYLQAIQALMDAGLANKLDKGAKAADSNLLDGQDSAAYWKKSEFDPAGAIQVWSGLSVNVSVSSFPAEHRGPGHFLINARYLSDEEDRQFTVRVADWSHRIHGAAGAYLEAGKEVTIVTVEILNSIFRVYQTIVDPITNLVLREPLPIISIWRLSA